MIKRIVKRLFCLYEIKELQVGGHCGLCGKWVQDIVLPKVWAITVCEKCNG